MLFGLQKINDLTKDYTRRFGEVVTVEVIGDTLYIFGSELATLRAFKYHATSKLVKHSYSEKRGFYCSFVLAFV
jgi:hypothetical protein